MEYTRKDIVNPASFISFIGLVVVVIGCFRLNTTAGLITVMAGRCFDLIDGPVARAMHTTKFSVFFDPTIDKLALTAILVSVLAFGLAPWGVIAYIFLENLLVSVLSIRAQRKSLAVGASIPGKLNMFFQVATILFFISARVLFTDHAHAIETVAYICLAVSIPLAALAIHGYKSLLTN